MRAKLIKRDESYWLHNQVGESIATSWGVVDGKKLSLKNCQAIENGYDLDKLADEYFKSTNENAVLWRRIDFKAGFQKALEVNSNKRFTFKEMVDCWNKALNFQEHKETLGDHMQSLQQTEWDVVAVTKNSRTGKIIKSESDLTWDEDGLCDVAVPVFDADGCLILKRK